ncbi:SKP1-like protein 5 [Oryza glaberrima]|uniref:Uncharacterized protein n=3 Tax=Oryza TaxID=4527 RepID=A0A0D3GC06_9ORYZ|nr:SKP1-like protein 5 [Oryza glaberrima]
MAEEDINKMMSSDGEISSMAERAASLLRELRQLIEDGCAAAKPLAEMVEYCAKHAAGDEAEGKEEEVLDDGESSDDEEETDMLRLEASLMDVENMLSVAAQRTAELIKDKDKPPEPEPSPEPSPENDPFHGFHSLHSFTERCYTD